MAKRVNIFDNIKTKQDLVGVLIGSAKRHEYFSFYTDKEGLTKTLGNGIRFTTGKNWNDKIDGKNLNNETDILRFAKCFTYSKSENIAMWLMYSVPETEGYMVKITKSRLEKLINELSSNDLVVSNTNGTVHCKINKEDIKVELIDIVYVGKTDSDLNLRKSTYTKDCENVDDVNLDDLPYFAKTYGWCYENETRLIISINTRNYNLQKLEGDDEYVIDFKTDIFKSSGIAIIPHPSNTSKDNDLLSGYKIKESFYKGKINLGVLEKYEKYFRKIFKISEV